MRNSGYYVVNDQKPVKQKSALADSGPPGPVLLTKMATQGVDIASEEVYREERAPSRSAITRLFSCIYALIIVVLGLVLATANVLTGEQRKHYYYLEAFQIYLYFLSLVVLLYLQGCLLWGVKTNRYDNNIRYSLRRSNAESPERDTEDRLTDMDKIRECSPFPDDSLRGRLMLPAEGSVAHVGDGINFYLRLGAIVFSIGSVTLDGFHISSYFETGSSSSTCRSHIFLVVYSLHVVFVFIQTFFIFKNHKLLVNKQKAMVRFGLMHLVATNICVWIISTINEAYDSFNQQDYLSKVAVNSSTGTTSPPVVQSLLTSGSCYAVVTLARFASPYLFPCTIQYSIIAGGIVFHMYRNVGVTIKQRWPSHASFTSSVPAGTTNVDCDKANKGLFLGLLIGVVTLVAIAIFFVFNSRLTDTGTAIKIFYITEISLLVITLIGVIIGFARLSRLKFTETRDISLLGLLLVIALFGTYIYYCFIVLAIAFNFWKYSLVGFLALGCTIVALIEVTIQAAFLFDGLRRCSGCEEHISKKPGRAVVTFLLVCNLALSAVYIFETTKTAVAPIHQSFYGILAWNVITHICVPLLIFFRFHSSVCLSDIWFLPYQREKVP